jgi:hypothetical protein
MEIMLNGQLVTCTPDEYARLIQLGLIPTQSAGTKVSPIQITPQPSLPDDIVPLPKDDFPQQPKPRDRYEPDTDFWKNNRMHVVPLYGCIVDDHTQIGDPYQYKAFPEVKVQLDATQNQDGTIAIMPKVNVVADVKAADKTKYYVLKKKGADEWWSTKGDEFTTTDEKYARLFTNPEEARRIIELTGSRFGELEIVPYIKK